MARTIEYPNDTSIDGETGEVSFFASGGTLPTGWLECDGTSLTRSVYIYLFNVIGTTFGAVDATHFTLPDLRGEFIRCWDNGKGTDSGRSFGTFQGHATLNHGHSATTSNPGSFPSNTMYSAGGTVNFEYATRYGTFVGNDGRKYNDVTHTHGFTTGSPSTGSFSETRPRNIAMLVCIKI